MIKRGIVQIWRTHGGTGDSPNEHGVGPRKTGPAQKVPSFDRIKWEVNFGRTHEWVRQLPRDHPWLPGSLISGLTFTRGGLSGGQPVDVSAVQSVFYSSMYPANQNSDTRKYCPPDCPADTVGVLTGWEMAGGPKDRHQLHLHPVTTFQRHLAAEPHFACKPVSSKHVDDGSCIICPICWICKSTLAYRTRIDAKDEIFNANHTVARSLAHT
jgi:hypothetical protein